MCFRCRHRFFAPIGVFLLGIFCQWICIPPIYGAVRALSAGADASGVISILDSPMVEAYNGGGGVVVGDDCPQGICADLLPVNGTIEGRRVSAILPAGVNGIGQIVGQCVLEGDAGKYAFVRESDGRIWIFRPPTPTGHGEFTDISDSGFAVGVYEKKPSEPQIGFLMNAGKQWEMDITFPANLCPHSQAYLHTQPNGINDSGEIVGNYDCTTHPGDAANGLFRGNGFYRAPDGTYYRVQFEDAARTVAGKISNLGVIIGYYVVGNDFWVPFAARKEDVLQPLVP